MTTALFTITIIMKIMTTSRILQNDDLRLRAFLLRFWRVGTLKAQTSGLG